MEKQIKRQEIYNGKVIHVVLDDIETDDGKMAKREVVIHNGGVCVALKDSDGKFFMVRQYRYALSRDMLEFCAGKIEKGEEPLKAILREVEEELGYRALNLRSLGSIIPTCGYCSERIHLYYAEKGEYCGTNFDEDEKIEAEKYTFDEIRSMIAKGEIDDAKTIALMYRIEMEGLNGN